MMLGTYLKLIRNLACPSLSGLHRTRGRCCMAGLKRRKHYDHERRELLAGAAAPGPTRDSSAAQPAAAPSAEAVAVAAQTTAQGHVTQDSTRVFQRARAIGDAAVTPARSAEQDATAPVRTPAERARNISSAAARRTADGGPEPGGAAGTGPHVGGACHLSLAMLLSPRALISPTL